MSRRPLADVLPAVAHVLGVPGFEQRGALLEGVLGQQRPRHVVVLLVDGLGAQQLDQMQADAPVLAGMRELGPLAAPFPSTTCVSLTSFGTGLPPGMHGIVGTSFRLDGRVLAPLSWGADPNPIATQPEPTVLERAESAGALVASVAPGPHRMSGLTRAALRGGEYVPAGTADERIAGVAAVLGRAEQEGRACLVYVYWPDLDKAGHIFGAASAEYRAELQRVDALVAGLLGTLGPQSLLLVTADHGHVDVPDDRRIDLEADPALREGVEIILGEPRVRHVYAHPGRAESVRATWARVLGERAEVLSRAQALALLGPVDPWYEDRVGDVVAIARDDWGLVSERVDRIVSSLRGQHGALTDAEVLVPLRMAVG